MAPPSKDEKTKEREGNLLLAEAFILIDNLNELNVYVDQENYEFQIDDVAIRLESMETISKEYKDISVKLHALSVTHKDIIAVADFNNKYYYSVAKARKLIKDIQKTEQPVNSEIKATNNDNQLFANSTNTQATLPKLSLPNFNGEYSDWISFKENFLSIVDNQPNLSGVQKFHYLRGCLKQSAAQLIYGLAPTNDNYRIAFDLLQERFEQPNLILQNHIQNIFNIKPMTANNSTQLQQIYDTFAKSIRSIKNQQITDSQFLAGILAHILFSKFNHETKQAFKKFNPDIVLTIDDINDFLTKRCKLLVHLDNDYDLSNKQSKAGHSNANPKEFRKQASCFAATQNAKCSLCKEEHFITQCSKFLTLPPESRVEKIRDLKICNNCLRHNRDLPCRSKYTCKICRKFHHTLLHCAVKHNRDAAVNSEGKEEVPVSLACQTNQTIVLLSTALVNVLDSKGNTHKARCLLDSASQINFISESFCERLNLAKTASKTTISGINVRTSAVNYKTNLQLESRYAHFQLDLSCLIIPKITECLPLCSFDKSLVSIPREMTLADPDFSKSKDVDILIGASHFYSLLQPEQYYLGPNMPIMQNTTFGWIISGSINISNSCCYTNLFAVGCATNCNKDIQKSLARLCELEEVQPKHATSLLSSDEQFCERHFAETVSRNSDGRYVVSIPFNSKLSLIGDTQEAAIKRFISTEKRLNKNLELKKQYACFLEDYLNQGHMSKVACGEILQKPHFVLPHHEVIKTSSLTTKLRVVFDGSAKSKTGVSLNDAQYCGPVIQSDLCSILIQFRKHQIALTGDIEKMYRQILVEPEQCKFQCIFWRQNKGDQLKLFKLKTITYGTTAASYLATKCLSHLANENSKIFPKASQVIKTDFYMDDLLTGADSIEETLQLQKEISSILSSACFPLRKFLSNSAELLNHLTSSSLQLHTVPLGDRESAKTLGIIWNSSLDTIQYNVKQFNDTSKIISKRIVLSNIGQLYDPLGLLSPALITGKLIMQQLWSSKLSWDEQLPENLEAQWNEFHRQLPMLNKLQIPRCVVLANTVSCQLHGFSDASEKAYGACIYVRCCDSLGHISSNLLCSKSRVAPLRSVSLPRLELCAATLLAQLMHKVTVSLAVSFHQKMYWSDSTIVIAWIHSVPNKYHTFVANRIAVIQELSHPQDWFHVKSQDNPADLVSRGVQSSLLLCSSLWWTGPTFLASDPKGWPKVSNLVDTVVPEIKITCSASPEICCGVIHTFNLFELYSNLNKLQRVTAWIMRFATNARLPLKNRTTGPLTTKELLHVMTSLILICQKEAFSKDIKALREQAPVSKNSGILNLNPVLDKNQVLRVGGRLKNSNFSYDKKYPILLPKNHIFSTMIMKYYHEKLLHCGAQQLLACVRENFWPISGRNLAKLIVRKCVKCVKVTPTMGIPIMGNLPSNRILANERPFFCTGIDYAGPLMLKDRSTRNPKKIKAYICVFVCLVTKAIHLELVTSLTTEAFILCLKRFIARRGKPSKLYSDNATNFSGASNLLQELQSLFKSPDHKEKLSQFLSRDFIQWHFIPARSPHFGGLWESGVKSVKLHLQRVLGNAFLNYEEFYTVLVQIEAVLNSRPLSPLSTEPDDYNPLTTGHFLIGQSMCDLPAEDVTHLQENRLSQYQRLQNLTQHFWKRWSKEVVPELQKRTKWLKSGSSQIKLGDLVLVKEENLRPLQWPLARVIRLHSGNDSIIRAVTVKFANDSVSKRAIHKLCVLPTEA